MLEALDRVTWADYRHAYGPAVDVPELLRALAFGDEGARGRAKYALYGNLWHQGTVYEASAHAVVFLIEMLAPGSNADRAFVLQYLGDLAAGSSYLDVCQGSPPFEGRPHEPELRAERARQLAWVREAHEAVRRGVPMYLAFAVDHESADVRAAAWRLLARFPEDAGELADAALAAARHDRDDVVRASALLAFDWLCPAPGRAEAACEERWRNDPSEFVRWVAAWAWAASAREKTPPAAADLLASALAGARRFEGRLARLGWFDDDPLAVTARALGALGPLHARANVPRLAEALDVASPHGALALADAMLGLAFGGPCEGGPFLSLTASQQSALVTIARSDKAWAFRARLAELLRAYGLPDGRERLRAFVGQGACPAPAFDSLARPAPAFGSFARPAPTFGSFARSAPARLVRARRRGAAGRARLARLRDELAFDRRRSRYSSRRARRCDRRSLALGATVARKKAAQTAFFCQLPRRNITPAASACSE